MGRVPSVNNLIFSQKVKEMPPYLIEFQNVLGYQTYTSTYNNLLYVVFNNNDNLYYIFQDEGSVNIVKSLKWCIKTFIIQS